MLCASLATPEREACDALGGAFRPEWRERPGQKFPDSIQNLIRTCTTVPKPAGHLRGAERPPDPHAGF
jgi:hypothetical protein